MKGPTPRRLQKYVTRCLGRRAYVQSPGDGRVQPQIPASPLLWALLIGQVLRDYAFHAIEASLARGLVLSIFSAPVAPHWQRFRNLSAATAALRILCIH